MYVYVPKLSKFLIGMNNDALFSNSSGRGILSDYINKPRPHEWVTADCVRHWKCECKVTHTARLKYKTWDEIDVISLLPIVSEKHINFGVAVCFQCGHIDHLSEFISSATEQTGENHGCPAALKQTLWASSVVLRVNTESQYRVIWTTFMLLFGAWKRRYAFKNQHEDSAKHPLFFHIRKPF